MDGMYKILGALATAGILLNVFLYIRDVEVFEPKIAEASSHGHLTATLIGGLGNHMFIYASLYGLSKKTNRIPHACTKYDMSRLFPNLSVIMHSRKNCASIPIPNTQEKVLRISQRYSNHYFDPHILQSIKMSNNSHIHITGFLQNLGFFVEYFDDLRREFAISSMQRNKGYRYLNKQIALYREKNHINGSLQIVGVHVRRGDMLTVTGIKGPTEAYFKKAMTYFRSKYKNQVLFVVSSDDIKWCHKYLKNKDVVFTADSGRKSKEDDFSIQVCCNHTIMSFGTFGWWIAFLTQGEVTVFRDWVGTSKARGWYLPGQRFPLNWKLL